MWVSQRVTHRSGNVLDPDLKEKGSSWMLRRPYTLTSGFAAFIKPSCEISSALDLQRHSSHACMDTINQL